MLEVISINDSDRWDDIVRSFKDHDVYYLSGYVKAFQIHGDGEPQLIYFEKENTRAINVVMKRDISLHKDFTNKINPGKYFDFSTPYGYGGFIIEGEEVTSLDVEYSNYCVEHNIVSEFVRFHPILNNQKQVSNIYEIKMLSKTISIDLDSKSMIWENLTSKNRNMIRKALKSNVKIYWGRSPELIEKFIPMYNQTMDRDEATDYYYFDKAFYDSILDDLKYNSLFFYAEYNNQIISMAIILFSNSQMHYHLSASNRDFQSLGANNLLLYEVACWGSEHGFKSFHLGGGVGSKEDSLYKFKKAFNKNSNAIFSIGSKIFDKELYDKLIEIRGYEASLLNSSYFPIYRAPIK